MAIDIVKYVSPDGGSSWFNADTPPGPFIIAPQIPWFRYVVTNTGPEILFDVTITDSVLGLIIVIGQLNPGESDEHIRTGSWAPGQQCNIATATAAIEPQGPIAFTDTDGACYFGVEAEAIPSIMIEKFVSVNDGGTFIAAHTSPGPLLPDGVTPQFKLVVTNNGQTPLQNVTVTDSVFGLVANIPLMFPGQSIPFILM
jgi:hypothetical protein